MGNRREDFVVLELPWILIAVEILKTYLDRWKKYTEPPLVVEFLILIAGLSLCKMYQQFWKLGKGYTGTLYCLCNSVYEAVVTQCVFLGAARVHS